MNSYCIGHLLPDALLCLVSGHTRIDVVVLLFYVHGKHLKVMSGRSVNLTTLFLGRLRPRKRLTSSSCTYFRQ